MRYRAAGEIPRVDLDGVRRFVPALWKEWRELEFDPRGHLLDPDTGVPLTALQLRDGRHRVPGACHLAASGASQWTFTLVGDDGRTVRGTLVARAGAST